MIAIKDKGIANYIAGLSDLQSDIVLAIRDVVLSADDRIKESVKWGSIAFHHKKNICRFRIAKAHVALLFMEGASLKTPNILLGDGAKARTYKVSNLNNIESESLSGLVKESLQIGM